MGAPYAQLVDCTDPVVRVTQPHLDAADLDITALLNGRGIDPDTMTPSTDGVALLRALAVAYAGHEAALEGARDKESVLWDKVEHYKRKYLDLAHRVNRESLGLAASSSSAGYASATTERA